MTAVIERWATTDERPPHAIWSSVGAAGGFDAAVRELRVVLRWPSWTSSATAVWATAWSGRRASRGEQLRQQVERLVAGSLLVVGGSGP
jgi:hypothetical protein